MMPSSKWFLLILLLLPSCKMIHIRLLLGIKNPKVESCASINTFLDEQKLDSLNSFVFNDSIYIDLVTKHQKYFSTYEVYNSSFKKLILIDSLKNDCYGSITKELMLLEKGSWSEDTTAIFDYKSLIKELRPTSNKSIDEIQEKSYYIVFYWAKFMGTYTKSLLQIAKELERNPRYKVILINMDINDQMKKELQQIEMKIN